MLKTVVTSVAVEQIARNNICPALDAPYYNEFEFDKLWGTPMRPGEYAVREDGIATGEWEQAIEPDVVVWKGWFVKDAYTYWKHQRFMGDVGQKYNPKCNKAEKVIILWAGSDVHMMAMYWDHLGRYKAKVFRDLCTNRFVHVPVSEEQKEQLFNMFGIKATSPLPSPVRTKFTPLPMPKDFTVAIYLPPYHEKMMQFRAGLLFALAKAMPKTKFIFYHWLFKSPDMLNVPIEPNIEYRYACNREEYEQVIKDSVCLLRIPTTEGMSGGAAEFLMANRPVLSCHDMPKYPAILKPNDLTVDAIKEVLSTIPYEVPEETRAHLTNLFDMDKFRGRLNARIAPKWGIEL